MQRSNKGGEGDDGSLTTSNFFGVQEMMFWESLCDKWSSELTGSKCFFKDIYYWSSKGIKGGRVSDKKVIGMKNMSNLYEFISIYHIWHTDYVYIQVVYCQSLVEAYKYNVQSIEAEPEHLWFVIESWKICGMFFFVCLFFLRGNNLPGDFWSLMWRVAHVTS